MYILSLVIQISRFKLPKWYVVGTFATVVPKSLNQFIRLLHIYLTQFNLIYIFFFAIATSGPCPLVITVSLRNKNAKC